MSDLQIELLQEKDREQTIDCIVSAFVTGEPMIKALGITAEEFEKFTSIFVNKAIEDQLSFIAKDENTGRVAGCVINEDLASDPPEGLEHITPKMFAVFALLEKLSENFRKLHNIEKGNIFHMFIGAVRTEYSGSNIVCTLVKKSEEVAAQRNFKGSLIETTGPVSQYVISKKMEYLEMDRVSYKDFVFEDKKVFKEISDCDCCTLMFKPLK